MADVQVTSTPYTITDISYFVLDNLHPEISGRLAISMCPGKKDKKWNRDLDQDLAVIKENGIQIIVCLLEWSEMKRLQISHYPQRAQDEGFLFYH
ncbi:MAG: hypothetical protein ABIQ41_05390, partial [Gemmatimonadales bacterium]